MGEMRIKRRLLLAGPIAAVVVLAVPALALSAVWKDKGTNIKTLTEISLTGAELFETSAGNGMNCGLKATLRTEGGSTGEITTFDITECPSGFGTFKGCSVTSSTAKGLPWPVDVNATDLTVTGWRVKRVFGAGCPIGELDKTIASMTVKLDVPSAFSVLEFSGETTGYKTVGSLAVSEANQGTWGIG
jgi:hypothetical protein